MTDLERLLASDATPFERELLAAAANERPGPELELRMRRALGLAPVEGGSEGAPEGSSAPGRERAPTPLEAAPSAPGTSAWLGAAKWVALLAGGAALVTVGLDRGRDAEPTPPSAATTEAPALAADDPTPNEPSNEAPAPPASEGAASLGEPAPTSEAAASARSLREEIALLDRARAALARGARGPGLEALDEHARRFPNGMLAREAATLRRKLSTEGAR